MGIRHACVVKEVCNYFIDFSPSSFGCPTPAPNTSDAEVEVPGPHKQEECWLHRDYPSSPQRQTRTKGKQQEAECRFAFLRFTRSHG